MEVRELLEDADTDHRFVTVPLSLPHACAWACHDALSARFAWHSGDLDFDEFLKAVREAGPASPWASLGTSDSQGHAEREAVVRAEASLSRVLAPLHTQAHKDALLMAEGDPTRYIALPGTDVAVPLATPGSRILGRTLSLLVLLAASVAAAALTAATAGTVAAAVHLYNRPSLDISLAVLAGLAEGGHMRWALLGGALFGPLAFASFPALRRGKTVAAWLAGNTVIVASTGRPLHPLLTMLRESMSGMCLPLDLGFALCVSPSGQRLVDYLLGTQVVADVTADVAA